MHLFKIGQTRAPKQSGQQELRNQEDNMEFVNRLQILLTTIRMPLTEWCLGQVLYASSHPLNEADIAKRLNVPRSEMSKYVHDAEQMGILVRIPGQGIALTAGGRRQFGAMLTQSFAIIRGEQKGFSLDMAKSFYETQKLSGIAAKQSSELSNFTDISFAPLNELT